MATYRNRRDDETVDISIRAIEFLNSLLLVSGATIKAATAFMLLLTATALHLDAVKINDLPHYHQITDYDRHIWPLLLCLLAVLQLAAMLRHRCLPLRTLGDLTLQLSGLAMMIIGGAFTASYPPFNWMMGIYPAWGLMAVFAGRSLCRRSRGYLKERQE